MNLLKLTSHNFFYDFFEEGIITPFYKMDNVPDSFIKTDADYQAIDNDLAIINCIPPYLTENKLSLKKGYGSFTRTYRLGYAMYLPGFSSAREYLRSQLGKKPYKNLRQDFQRLERDHNIEVKMYHGDIERNTYEEIFEKLEEFIIGRFDNKNRNHSAFKRWEFYKKSVYNRIKEKMASFIVIYNNGSPIGISLSYHYQNILFAAVTCFNDDYGRYSIGKQMFAQQLEWCYENNLDLLDTGWGNYPYKIKFSNAIYKYENDIVYPKANFIKRIIAFFVSYLFLFKNKYQIFKNLGYKSPKKIYGEDRMSKLKDFKVTSHQQHKEELTGILSANLR